MTEKNRGIMEWLDWVLDESSQSMQYNGDQRGDGFPNRRRISMDKLAADEREDIDYVIALSLAEHDMIELESQAAGIDENKQRPARSSPEEGEDDEQLAKAIEESLYVRSPSRYNRGKATRTVPLPLTSSDRSCKGCCARIDQDGQSIRCMGAVWHPDCFLCHGCNLPITDKEYSISKKDEPYHESCHMEHHHPKCDVCMNFLPQSTAGIDFRLHPFWMQKYCPSHEQDGTPRCCSCTKMESRDVQYMALDDGRRLCLVCFNSAIMDSYESQPLYREVREFYKGLNMEVEQQIPLLLVERQALNEAIEGDKKNGHHRHLPETRGICLWEPQSIPMITKNRRVGAGSQIIPMTTEPHKLVRSHDVTAILVLYGFPRLLTGSILAHEMMHAWLRLAGYSKLSPDVEEGICQVMAHMWLNMEVGARFSTPEEQLGAFFIYQIERDESPVYGQGFRSGHRAVTNYGLESTLNHIRMTGRFPL